jgi:cytosol alanyl aminopeptidase
MNRPRTAWILTLILLAAAAFADDGRLGTDVRPTYQVIELKIDPSTASYSGATRISLKVEKEVPAIRLHSEGIEISKIRLEGAEGVINAKHASEKDILTITPAKPLAPGTYGLRIEFTNQFNTQAVGLYRMESGGLGYAYTQFQAIDARKAFPCFDEPGVKIPYQLRVTAREADAVVSNTPVRYESKSAGWKTLEFQTTKPLPTYLLAVAVGPMDSIEIPDLSIPGRVYTPRGQAALATYTAKMVAPILKAQEEYFATPYPYEKLDFIAIPEYWAGAMEHPGAVTYRDSVLLLDPSRVSAGQRRNAARIISHELAHMWFGNLVTMAWWDDLWLNESFADWFGDKIVVQLHPEMKHDLAELRDLNGVMSSDALVTAEPIRKPVATGADLLGNVGLAYDKGKAVIGMFERWIGPVAFRAGVNRYLRENAWGNARADAFWSALSEEAGADVAGAMSTFLDQPGIPLVEITHDGNAITLRQMRFASYGSKVSAQTWRIPVGLRVTSGGSIVDRTVLLTGSETTIEIEGVAAIDRIVPDADGSGYYRWSLGDEALLALASAPAGTLTERERVKLIGNLGALLEGGIVGGDTYLEILAVLAKDEEPFVVSAVVSEIGAVREAFVTDDLVDDYARYVKATLSPALDRFGLEPRPGEDATVADFRPRLIAWMGDVAGDEAVVAWAKARAAAYMNDPASLDPAIARVCLEILAKNGDRALFDRMKKEFLEAKSPAVRANYLGALGGFDDPEIRDAALAFALEGTIRPNELFAIPGGIGDSSAGAEIVFTWMTTNYDAIAAKLPPLFLPYLTAVGGGCEIDRLTRTKEFFSRPGRSVDGTETRLKRVEASVLACVDLRQREGEKVRAFLEGM